MCVREIKRYEGWKEKISHVFNQICEQQKRENGIKPPLEEILAKTFPVQIKR